MSSDIAHNADPPLPDLPAKEVPVEVECGFDEDGRRFRHRAAAVILHASRVLMARNDSEPYF